MRETIGFGIDLGTTNSAVADCSGGSPMIVKNNDSADTTPSVVWMPRAGTVHVGARARLRAETDPHNTAAEFKRGMGYADVTHRFAAAGASLTPVELSAEVLKSLCADVEHVTGERPTAAVITVPAAFALNQNDATSRAAALAGLGEHCPLIQEPTAAAFAYGLADEGDQGRWMVFDLGGGTFDAAVVSKRDGELTVLDHAGDPHLGGKDIDLAIVTGLLVPAVERDLGLTGLRRGDPRTDGILGRLKIAAEDTKIALSRRSEEPMFIDLPVDGRTEIFEYTLTRAALDEVAMPFYDRAIALCRAALAEAGLRPGDIERLLLVGGATLAPGLRARLADPVHGLGIPLDHSQDASTVVARGAAIFAATVPLPRRAVTPRAGSYTVDLEHPPTTNARTVTVGGRLRTAGRVDWTTFGIVLENPDARPAFRSAVLRPSPDGAFLTEVPVEPKGVSEFRLTLTDATGARQDLTPDTLRIRFQDGPELGVPVLTQSLGISLADHRFAALIAKGTPLPANARETFHTSETLRPSDTDRVLRIAIVEGERPRADRNREVAVLQIRPTDLTGEMRVGTEVEVTFRVDASRRISAVAVIPRGDLQVDADIDLANVRSPDPAELAQRLQEAEDRLARLRDEVDMVGAAPVRRMLDDAHGASGAVARDVRDASASPDDAVRAEQRLRDLQAELDRVEDAVKAPQLRGEIADGLADCAQLTTRNGGPDDQRRLADLHRRSADLESSDDLAELTRLRDDTRRLWHSLFRRDPLRDAHLFLMFRDHQHLLEPPDQVPSLIREGEAALDRTDLDGLARVNERLRRLIPPDEESPVIGLLRGGR